MPSPASPTPSAPDPENRDLAADMRRTTADAINSYLHPEIPAVTEDEAQAWIDGSTDPADEMAKWVRIGIRTPQQRPDALPFKDVQRLACLKVKDPDAQWAGISDTCVLAHRALTEAEKGIGETIALALALADASDRVHPWTREDRRNRCGTRGCFCGRHVSHVTDAETVAAEARDLDWADLTVCLRAGLTPTEAIDHVRERRDMAPVRAMAALG